VGDVGRERRHLGEPVPRHGEVDEQVVGSPVDVGQQPVVAVAGLDVPHQANRRPGRDELGQVGGRLLAEALDRPARIDRLWGVDADQPDRLVLALHVHDQGVAVDHAGDGGGAGVAVGCRSTATAAGSRQEDERAEDEPGHGAYGARSL
jgi:hypothetical protein